MPLCEFCNKKKLPPMPFNCRCGLNNLCTKCRLPNDHACKYDYIRDGKENILKNNPTIIASQI